jgi:hypothetical protein
MEVIQAVENLRQHFEDFLTSAKEKVEQELPVVGNLAQQASANPAVTALLSAVHLGEAPELLAELAQTIIKIDVQRAAAKAAGAAAAQQPPADPPPPAA